jgi:hypothetical protein
MADPRRTYFTVEECADLAGVPVEQILADIESGRLKAIPAPRTYQVVRRFMVRVRL